MRIRITLDIERHRPDPPAEEPQRDVEMGSLVESTDPLGSARPPFGFQPRTTEPT